MEWSLIVLTVQILLLIAGWLLFQQAKSDLTARAAQVPVLAEVRALQKSIAALLEQLKLESTQASAQLEARCLQARDLLAALDRRLEEGERTEVAPPVRRRETSAVVPPPSADTAPVHLNTAVDPRYQEVYSLFDRGVDSAGIAQHIGLSEGEVELILGLRSQAS